MNKSAELKKLDTIKHQLTEGSKNHPLKKVKRVFDTGVTCKECNHSTVLSNITYAFLCSKCGKFNNTEEAKKLFEKGSIHFSESKQSTAIEAPAFKTMDKQKKEYAQLRDESEIRSEFFVNGKTRESLGVETFQRELKSELVKNKAYRGAKTGF